MSARSRWVVTSLSSLRASIDNGNCVEKGSTIAHNVVTDRISGLGPRPHVFPSVETYRAILYYAYILRDEEDRHS